MNNTIKFGNLYIEVHDRYQQDCMIIPISSSDGEFYECLIFESEDITTYFDKVHINYLLNEKNFRSIIDLE